jgi:hypothetical protein
MMTKLFRLRLPFALLIALTSAKTGITAGRMQFWNLTGTAIRHLYLAPAGSTAWGGDQCANDPDGAVDPDERLRLTNVGPGRYDVKLIDARGRTCLVRNVELRGDRPYAFSLSESDLTDCTKAPPR